MTSTNTTQEATSITAYMQAVEARVTKPEKPFAEILLPERCLKETNWNNYHIYKNATEFVKVEADAAYEAIAKSGIARPFKVVRAMKEVGSVLTVNNMAEQLHAIHDKPEEIPQNSIIAPPSVR
jgi:hypothetical protein